MPATFLWKVRHKNAYGFLPTLGQGIGKIRVFAHGSESRRFSHRHTAFVENMMRAPARSRRYAPVKTGHFAAHADPQIGAVLNLMRRYFGSAAFLRMMSELNQKPSQPGILFKQRVLVVAVFVTPK